MHYPAIYSHFNIC